MRKFLFTALAFVSLGLASCSDKIDNGSSETPDYEYVNSHLNFVYDLQGDVASMVDVVPTTNLPASQGTLSSSKEGTKYVVSLSNIKCPNTFNITCTLKPKSNVTIEENKTYSFKLDCSFSVIRNFTDGSHITASSESSPTLTGSFSGKDAAEFFEKNSTWVYEFGMSSDGFYEEISED